MSEKIESVLAGNTYPGRGIIIGRANERISVIAYFIMGRSVNSRNRMFETTPDGIRTVACDPEKLTDPSLVIYHPVRELDGCTIVTNGDQTDTIRDFLQSGRSFYDACLSRIYEPDPPIWTPRISGMLDNNGNYRLAIVKNIGGEREIPQHSFFEYSKPVAGTGHFIRTYERDGNPPASFSGEPVEVEIDLSHGISKLAGNIWNALDANNRVSLHVLAKDTETDTTMYEIINKYELVTP